MARVDLNCDLGEGFAHDAMLMPLITSANIACGAHAGDEATMRATIRLAQRHGVAIGAHPGYPDRENFGRREMAQPEAAVQALVRDQVRVLQNVARECRATVRHLKLHGALYNQAAREPALARGVVELMHERAFAGLALFVLSGSELERVARADGRMTVVAEVFADRTYRLDGSLTPRSRPDALISDENVAVAQARRMVQAGRVRATEGAEIALRAETICLHGDGPYPVAFARRLRAELEAGGVEIRAPGA